MQSILKKVYIIQNKVISLHQQIKVTMKIEINFSEVEYSDRLKRVSIRIEEDGKVKMYDECYDSTLVAIDQAKVIGSSIATFLMKEVQCFVEKNI